MGYSTATSILLILPGLPQTDTSSGYTATVAVIEAHITRADNLINSKVVDRYDVSGFATSVPPMVKTISEDITSFYSFRSFYSQDNQNYSEYLDKFQESIKMLDEIRNSNMDLIDASGNIISDRTTASFDLVDGNNIDYQSYFDVDEPTAWKFDEDLKDEVEDGRQ